MSVASAGRSVRFPWTPDRQPLPDHVADDLGASLSIHRLLAAFTGNAK
ncbi:MULTISPECIES: hypothetical protein [unclassified Streptomyces]|uniref:Uncharacterized protein n=1 Tax=Streptomyces sp. NBC_00060 TaxID=2975636 RepID=A0AAU2GSE4_9ACTN